jgi:YidC/Oxa1 family membrane protein insertase
MSLARRKAGVNMPAMFMPMVIQGALGFGAFRITRAMAALPVPGMETGGFAWLTNLTVADPYFIMPVALAGMLHVMGRVSTYLYLEWALTNISL